MYHEILEICAIISIVGLGSYPLLSKKNKPWKWYIKGTLSIYANLCIWHIYYFSFTFRLEN